MDKIKSLLSFIGKQRIYLFAFIFLFFGLLAIYGIKGTFSRYSQDDYCYGYRVRTEGFWNMQIQTYLHPTEFNSNRYSLTIAHSLTELLGGPGFVPFLPALELLAWAVSLVYLFFQLRAFKFTGKNLLVAVASALAILFFTFYMAPNLYQILFWLSGMQTYLTPMVWATFLAGRFIAIVRSPKFKLRHAIELGILCFFAGGFSETTALWQFVCWGLLLGWSVSFRARSAIAKKALWPSLVTVLSTALSLVVLAVCPVNFKFAFYTRPNLITLIRQPLVYGAEFIFVSLKGAPLPYLAVMALGFLLSLTLPRDDQRKPGAHLVGILVGAAVLYILTVVVMVPAMYATAHYPGDRTLFPADFTLIVFLFFMGWKSAELVSAYRPDLFSHRFSKVLPVLLGLALFGYVARTAPRVYDKLPLYQQRAAGWDVRQSMILEAKAQGTRNVTVPAFDSVYGITELHYEPTNWVNICAARYYGVTSISTVDNYQGIPAYPIGK